jgi:hypothetical protein
MITVVPHDFIFCANTQFNLEIKQKNLIAKAQIDAVLVLTV